MSHKKVLLVDPDTRTRGWVSIRLEAMDVDVAQAVSAEEALRLLKSQEIHLVITDWPLEGGTPAANFFDKLNRDKKPFILFSQSPREDSKWYVPHQDRDRLMEQVSNFFQPKSPGSESPAPFSRKIRQILIIEDSPTLRGMLRRTLTKAFPDDEIREAEEGRQAFSEMSQKKVDLIITDLEMPGMDGRTFLNLLKTNPILSKKPVLVFSSNLTSELLEMAAGMPRVRLLAKPASQEKIIEEVSFLMGDPKMA